MGTIQFSSLLVIRGFGSSRARGSCWARIIPNTSVRSCQILPDRARSCQIPNIGFPGLGPWGPSRSSWEAPGSPKRVPRNLPETIIGKLRQSSTKKSSKVDRKGRPSGPETRLSMFFDRFGVQFSLSLRLHRVSDSIHRGKGHTPVFTDRRDTLEGSQTFEKDRRSTTINEKTLRQGFANELHEKN